MKKDQNVQPIGTELHCVASEGLKEEIEKEIEDDSPDLQTKAELEELISKKTVNDGHARSGS